MEKEPHMASRTLSGALALTAAASVALAVPVGTAQASPPGTKDVTAVLFEWDFDSVATECASRLGPAGYQAPAWPACRNRERRPSATSL